MKISSRAAGDLAGVVLERHLQRVAENHKRPIRKKAPTISDLNDPFASCVEALIFGKHRPLSIEVVAYEKDWG
ncbi:MAG: hypothetical protein HW390_2684 [Candidatus Brocadiaceae bacterium]|nr:hypothetical protein [Candidatus Brocadiaceae bacterium]